MILTFHNPAWAAEFVALRDVYATALGDLILQVEHVGSTAVPDLQAKPILDIDLVMQDYEVFPKIVEGLGRLGYSHNGDQGIRHREAFKPQDGTVPFTSTPRRWMLHHLYVCPVGSTELWRHVVFRDALRARADLREEYDKMKRSIADRSGDDRKTYAQIKEVECRAFFERVLNEGPNSITHRSSRAVHSTSRHRTPTPRSGLVQPVVTAQRGVEPAILDEASPAHLTSSSEKTACAQPSRG